MAGQTATDRSPIVSSDLQLPWWASQRAPPFLPRRSKSTCERHAGLYGVAIFIFVNCGDYPLVYLDDTDPHQWHFIAFYSALLSALLCCVALGVVDPGIRPPPLHHALANGGDPNWLADHCGPPPDPTTLPDDFKELIAQDYSPGKAPPKRDIDGVEVRPSRFHRRTHGHRHVHIPSCAPATQMRRVCYSCRNVCAVDTGPTGSQCASVLHALASSNPSAHTFRNPAVLLSQHKWCFTCKLWRPPGTVHCSECGFCIDNYDHHCGVIGHCVGKSNMRFFAGLLLSAGIAAATMLTACVLRAIELDDRGEAWENWNWYFTIVGCLYCSCLGLSFGPMGIGYFGVMCTAETMDMRMDANNSRSAPCLCLLELFFICVLIVSTVHPLAQHLRSVAHSLTCIRRTHDTHTRLSISSICLQRPRKSLHEVQCQDVCLHVLRSTCH
jgi:hypothetical protein